MSDQDELPEEKVLEFEETIRRLTDERRLPTLERFDRAMKRARDVYKATPREPSGGS